MMNKLLDLKSKVSSPKILKVFFILLTLTGISIAAGAPGAGSGIGGGPGLLNLIGL